MNPEANHNFMKIWGRIERDTIEKGNYTVVINNSKFIYLNKHFHHTLFLLFFEYFLHFLQIFRMDRFQEPF